MKNHFPGGVLAVLVLLAGLASCSTYKGSIETRKYAPEKLREDFMLFRNVLEESHPSLYWFITQDSLDYYFDTEFNALTDSLTERDFRTRLMYLAAKIRCGHTSVRYSRKFYRYLDTANPKTFPLSLTFWKDSAMVRGNLLRSTPLGRGTAIHSIDDIPVTDIRDSLFNYLTGDGFSIGGRYQSISNSGSFGALYRNVYGLKDSFSVRYTDSAGAVVNSRIPYFDPATDSLYIVRQKGARDRSRREKRQDQKMLTRNVQIDTALSSAYITLRTFSRGNGLPAFFRKTFRYINKAEIKNVVIDIRGNGGGDAGNAVMLIRYLANKPFRIADSLYAVKKGSQYRDHIKMQPLYWLMMNLVTHKKADGFYHFGFFERKVFEPKKKNHFKGDIYIITDGNSFSAASIFAQKLRGQHNVMIIGEETGGGAYGNTAWMIPEVRLPNTRLRFRLPKFRLVMEPALVPAGRGVLPDIEVAPSGEMIRRGFDMKSGVVRRLIELKQSL